MKQTIKLILEILTNTTKFTSTNFFRIVNGSIMCMCDFKTGNLILGLKIPELWKGRSLFVCSLTEKHLLALGFADRRFWPRI